MSLIHCRFGSKLGNITIKVRFIMNYDEVAVSLSTQSAYIFRKRYAFYPKTSSVLSKFMYDEVKVTLIILLFASYFSIDTSYCISHDDVNKCKHFPRYWPFVQGILRSPVNSPHKGQSRGALMFSLICV